MVSIAEASECRPPYTLTKIPPYVLVKKKIQEICGDSVELTAIETRPNSVKYYFTKNGRERVLVLTKEAFRQTDDALDMILENVRDLLKDDE